jgi:hypothetical protein
MADTSGRLNGLHRDNTICLATIAHCNPEEFTMNWNKLIAASFFAVLNVAAFSVHADVQAPAQTTAYGTHLDIKKVVSIVDNGGGTCGIVDARLTYLDSNGAQKVAGYSKFADCANQGG